ncbi:hypothetical protein ANCCAN_18029 [Ancylostoma caninum]|uniref:Uncharacterized protein n=1 Tax=Ancylostoma caninum TaxID=29170 RepID=A0A368FV59_ANCCA|nr:hypothetical protein ANCCAN_18029 [Ancylostoma caninum]
MNFSQLHSILHPPIRGIQLCSFRLLPGHCLILRRVPCCYRLLLQYSSQSHIRRRKGGNQAERRARTAQGSIRRR